MMYTIVKNILPYYIMKFDKNILNVQVNSIINSQKNIAFLNKKHFKIYIYLKIGSHISSSYHRVYYEIKGWKIFLFAEQ